MRRENDGNDAQNASRDHPAEGARNAMRESRIKDFYNLNPSGDNSQYPLHDKPSQTDSGEPISKATADFIYRTEFSELKINATEEDVHTVHDDVDGDDDDEDDDDDTYEEEYYEEYDELRRDYNEEESNTDSLSRTKRRKAKFTKKAMPGSYGGSKSSRTSGRPSMGGSDWSFGGSMRRKKKGKFSNEYYIKQKVLKNYDITTRPVRNDSTTVTVYIGMSLYHILDTVRTLSNPHAWFWSEPPRHRSGILTGAELILVRAPDLEIRRLN